MNAADLPLQQYIVDHLVAPASDHDHSTQRWLYRFPNDYGIILRLWAVDMCDGDFFSFLVVKFNADGGFNRSSDLKDMLRIRVVNNEYVNLKELRKAVLNVYRMSMIATAAGIIPNEQPSAP